jgi:hypothetical protein
VTESEELCCQRTGVKREADIVIRSNVGEHAVVISIECIEKKRPANVTWVEQMHAKHENLETDKLVLVSLKGFARSALKLATSYRISTYTPGQACTASWEPAYVFNFDSRLESIWIVVEDTPQEYQVPGTTYIRRPDIAVEGKLEDLAVFCLQHQSFLGPIRVFRRELANRFCGHLCNARRDLQSIMRQLVPLATPVGGIPNTS